jgi:hypothetical protein
MSEHLFNGREVEKEMSPRRHKKKIFPLKLKQNGLKVFSHKGATILFIIVNEKLASGPNVIKLIYKCS